MNYATQKLKPLTKNDLTDDLMGREVVWNSGKLRDLKVGKRYEVVDIDLEQGVIEIKDDVGDLRDLFIESFALPVEESEEKARHAAGCKGNCGGTLTCPKCKRAIGYCYVGDVDELCNDCWTPKEKQPKPVTEITHSCALEFPNCETVTVPDPEGFTDDWITKIMHFDKEILIPGPEDYDWNAETPHSCTLEFPNGETVTVPGPSGPGWTAETTRFDWPVVYTKVLSTTDRIKMHKEGSLIFEEYLGMLNREILKVRSITKWTRDPSCQPPEREETFEERAIRRYPSRMRG